MPSCGAPGGGGKHVSGALWLKVLNAHVSYGSTCPCKAAPCTLKQSMKASRPMRDLSKLRSCTSPRVSAFSRFACTAEHHGIRAIRSIIVYIITVLHQHLWVLLLTNAQLLMEIDDLAFCKSIVLISCTWCHISSRTQRSAGLHIVRSAFDFSSRSSWCLCKFSSSWMGGCCATVALETGRCIQFRDAIWTRHYEGGVFDGSRICNK